MDEVCLISAVRYVSLNPVRTQLVEGARLAAVERASAFGEGKMLNS
jgi:hypothetical protein